MKIKVSDASGPVLDWLVAKCEGYDCQFDDEASGPRLVPQEGYLHDEKPLTIYRPSTDWAQGGPLVEREKIGLGHAWEGNDWLASAHDIDSPLVIGPTPLIAAMRCYCTAKLGPEVEVPDELVNRGA